MKTVVYNGKIIAGDSIIPDGYVGIENSLITEIKRGIPSDRTVKMIDAGGRYISPGFINLHVHGAGECDLYKDTIRGIKNMARLLVKEGVTSFLPTLTTAPLEDIINAVSAISKTKESENIPLADVLGINLEGPYINPGKSGAQSRKEIRQPDVSELNRIISAGRGSVKIMTIAPEVDGNLELAVALKNNGIIPAIGHTMLNFEEAMHAIDRGIIYITHTFNAMTPFHHRAPGVLGAVFLRKEVITEIIADGVHVHPAVIRFLCQLKEREKIILVTDELVGFCTPAGEGKRADGAAAYSNDGLLIGSLTPMNRALWNIMQYASLNLTDAVKLATINPARVLGVDRYKGSLEAGKDADIVIFDEDFNIITTLVRGKICAE